ncbi:MBL fold metallo-hydrolase [Phytoactinopolyspora sp. XMNu-373]|uniref:MBL fold metallo-hydrolase n=1 Tax=Phytoactinopolyspora mesophila TaxID=2650750 RepID=A0A7K3LXF4_9ACTN|nr:MBL fold metallo-hydrolase [Phytoactinopolyspora mesophila]
MDLSVSVRQCEICGVEYDSASLPYVCPICADERQYLAEDRRQHWVDPADYTGRIEVFLAEPGLWSVRVGGGPGIDQQAKVIVTEAGNVMVEVPASMTNDAVEAVRALGPLRAIIASHPHMYGLQSLWSRALGDAVVYVSSLDREWLGLTPASVAFWDGEIELVPGVVASQPGGHFPGSSVVHWAGEDGAGVLLTGDTVAVNPDGESLAFMRSYPNRIPLSSSVVLRIADHLERYEFDRIYGNFGRAITHDASARLRSSAQRHAAWARGDYDHLTGPG